jgi:hypothetical protein
MTAKLFVFANNYLSGLQQGLQTAHLVADMAWEYTKGVPSKKNLKAAKLFEEWQTIHRTIIIFKGGNHDDLCALYDQLTDQRKYPVGRFEEDHQSLRGATTAVGIILPDPFDSFLGRKRADVSQMTEFEKELLELLDNAQLA